MAENLLEPGPPNSKRPKLNSPALSASDGPDLGSLSWEDLENDLPDDLMIPNGNDLGLMGAMPSTGGSAGPGGTPAGLGGGGGTMVPDAASKHKQLSELLRGGSASGMAGGGLNSVNPQPNSMGGQLGTALGKSPLGSPQTQKAGAPTTGLSGQSSSNNNSNAPAAAMGASAAGFNQGLVNSTKGHAALLAQGGKPQAGLVMNGGKGSRAGRGRGTAAAGMQYQAQPMQGAPPGGGSVLAETLAQGGQQMGAHPTLTAAQQGGNMNKMGLGSNGGPFGAQQLQNKSALPNSLGGASVTGVSNLVSPSSTQYSSVPHLLSLPTLLFYYSHNAPKDRRPEY